MLVANLTIETRQKRSESGPLAAADLAGTRSCGEQAGDMSHRLVGEGGGTTLGLPPLGLPPPSAPHLSGVVVVSCRQPPCVV